MAKEPASYALIPPEGDPKVGKKVFEVLAKVIVDKAALGLHDRWLRNHQLRRNQHWKAKSATVPLTGANLIYAHQQRTVNTLTDNDPTFNVAAIGKIEDEQRDRLTDLQHTTEHWWRDQEQQDIFESSVLNGECYGIAIEKVVFNPEIEYGLGEAETIPVDPFHFGWYPVRLAAIRDLQKCEAVMHFTFESVRKLKQKYPQLAEKIKSDTDYSEELGDDERRGIIGEGGGGKASIMATFLSTVRELLNFTNGTAGDDDEQTLQCEMWLRDKTQVPISEETDEATGKVKRISGPKYTGEIRYILACSGGVVLEDKDNPNISDTITEEQARLCYLYDKFPFAGANSIKDTSNAWGFSDTEEGENLNMEINKSLSQMTVEKDRSARKKFVNPLNSGVPNEHITNYVGILNPSSSEVGQGLRWIETPPTSIDYEKTIAVFKDFFFLVMGSFELDQAQVAGRDVIAYKAIAALLERAATMMRGKIRSYSRLIRDRGRMYVSMVQNFYTEDRWITYTDKDGNQASKRINGHELLLPAKLTVVSGSTMPISRVQQREEALALFEKGAIDQPELLDSLDWSNRAEVVKRMMAGPMGAFLNNLMTAQVPEQIVGFLKTVGEADPKELQKALEKGEIPPFMAFIEQMMQGAQETGPDPAQTEADAKMKEIEIKAEKAAAEIGLINEKTVTERINQTVSMAGVGYDEEMMKIKRAEVVHAMEEDAKNHHIDAVKTGLTLGKEMNQASQGSELENKKIDTGFELERQKIDQAGKPGYNEKGAKSNNKKK